MISISALTYNLFLGFNLYHGNSFSHLQSEIIRKEKEVKIPFGQHLLGQGPSFICTYLVALTCTHLNTEWE